MYKSKATAETVKVDRKCFAHQGALLRYWVGGMGKKDKKSCLFSLNVSGSGASVDIGLEVK